MINKPRSFALSAFSALISLLVFASCGTAVERRDVYRLSGTYRRADAERLTIYFPAKWEPMMPSIASSLDRVRNRLDRFFPDQAHFHPSVILTDFDHRIESSADPNFGLVTLGLFEKTGSLSMRGYPLEDRFALKLARIFILRILGSSKTAWRGRLSILSIPPWFIEGLASFYAFPEKVLHQSRLLAMARNNALYTPSQLDTLSSQPSPTREEMIFQAHSLIAFLHSLAGDNAGKSLLESIKSRPAQFPVLFQRFFKKSVNEAFGEYKDFMVRRCAEEQCEDTDDPESLSKSCRGYYFQSRKKFGENAFVWVSSSRYHEETYDLIHSEEESSHSILLKNVHPEIVVDNEEGRVFATRYNVNNRLQRKLTIYSVKPGECPKHLPVTHDIVKLLGYSDKKIYFAGSKHGVTGVFSRDMEPGNHTEQVAELPVGVRPLDLAFLPSTGDIAWVSKLGDGVGLFLFNHEDPWNPILAFETDGSIREPAFHNNRLWFTTEVSPNNMQLVSLKVLQDTTGAEKVVLTRHSALIGGVWDYTIDDGTGKVIVTTMKNGGFFPVEAAIEDLDQTEAMLQDYHLGNFSDSKIVFRLYRPEFLNSYWLPRVSEDDQGRTFGFYSYRSDRLGRTTIAVSPTWGFKSRHLGFQGSLLRQYESFNVEYSVSDSVLRKSYLSTSYHERIKTQGLRFRYPFSLAMTIHLGGNFSTRKIARFPANATLLPTAGKDHSLFIEAHHTGIRTEPHWGVFPRKGRTVVASFRRGSDILGGEMRYDSTSLRWNEFIPLKGDWVATMRGYLAEDDKATGVRRPEDLSLGGTDFLRGYKGSFRYGDSLRAFALHIGHPVNLRAPSFRNLLYTEKVIAEAFWEIGDVRTNRRFDFKENFGVELRGRCLIFRRIPLTLRVGVAWPVGMSGSNSYFLVDASSFPGMSF